MQAPDAICSDHSEVRATKVRAQHLLPSWGELLGGRQSVCSNMLLLIWLIIIDCLLGISKNGSAQFGSRSPEEEEEGKLKSLAVASRKGKPISGNGTVEVRIGFLTGSRRLKHDRTYLRPGLKLIHAFNYGIERINRLYDGDNLESGLQANQSEPWPQDDSSARRIKFVPVLAETYGNESESIRQTVQLITLQKVNIIVGPQESCQIEPRLAAVFNVPMISHYCAQWTQTEALAKQVGGSGTFIRTRPPHWKIVERVAALVGQLLAAYDCYPQQLVLLYFKTPSAAEDNGHRLLTREPMGSDAIQYKLIGELLEIKLNDLFVLSGHRKPPLVVLNWNTTFHYGFTKNPFRQLIRRHLFHQTLANQSHSDRNQASGPRKSTAAAIYVVVGHYYEHLGLMLALQELDLLNQEPAGGRSSVPTSRCRFGQSLVVGVDVEQYDERDDSVRFLRGLLMDSNDQSADSAAALYRSYMGVVPAKPARMADFVEEISALYNETNQQPAPGTKVLAAKEDTGNSIKLAAAPSPNQTLAPAEPSSVKMSARLLQFVRLPVEALYLYDSVMLTGAYFHDCIARAGAPLESCADGRRAFRWFQNRSYSSFLDNRQLRFDSGAQNEGLYNLITRRISNDSLDASDDEFGLVPVARFSDELALEFSVGPSGMDPLWLPLWCHSSEGANRAPECEALRELASAAEPPRPPTSRPTWLHWSLLAVVIVATLTGAAFCYLQQPARRVGWNKRLAGGSDQQANSGWFNQTDEDNFLKIVQCYLVPPETSAAAEAEDDELLCAAARAQVSESAQVELHCHMFPFPSCKFVHWLSALYQLKEMMFHYQSFSCANSVRNDNSISLASIRQLLKQTAKPPLANERAKRDFFTCRHKATGSLRLLLHKYKPINLSLCALGELNHPSLVSLLGVTLGAHKSARLILEQPTRGHLSQALKHVQAILEPEQADEFRQLQLWPSLLADLLDGLEYLHESRVGFHGELRASTCLISADWRLKLTGFHVHHLRRSLGDYEQKFAGSAQALHQKELVYTAPEVLAEQGRRNTMQGQTQRLADIYSFAFVAYELLVGQEPWSCLTDVANATLLLQRVKVDSSFRPPLSRLDKQSLQQLSASFDLDVIKRVIRSSWSHSPERRPQTVPTLRSRLLHSSAAGAITTSSSSPKLTAGASSSGSQLMKNYTDLLEKLSADQRCRLRSERQKSHHLELKLLPASVVAKLHSDQSVPTQSFQCVSLCSFSLTLCEQTQRREPSLKQLNAFQEQLELLLRTYRGHVHLLDSQVDSCLRYLVYSCDSLHQEDHKDKSAYNQHQLVASFALQLLDAARRLQSTSYAGLQLRCGLHCGPLLAGLLTGCKPSRYALLGPAVQVAHALESGCSAQRILISADFFTQLRQAQLGLVPAPELGCLKARQGYVVIKREAKVQARGVDLADSYWLMNGPCLTASQSLMLSVGSGSDDSDDAHSQPTSSSR